MATKLLEYQQTYTTDAYGGIDLTSILNVSAYNKVNVQLIQWPHLPLTLTVNCVMGKMSGSTLSAVVGQFPLGSSGTIHSFPVTGPEFNLRIVGGTPNTAVPIQAWIFLN